MLEKVLELEGKVKCSANTAKTVAYQNRLFVTFPNDFRIVGILTKDGWNIIFQYKEFKDELAWRCDAVSSLYDQTDAEFLENCAFVEKLDRISV